MFTNEAGNFTVVNVPPDKYTIQVTMQGFKPAKQTGVSVSPGDRQDVGIFTIEIGGTDRHGRGQGGNADDAGAQRRALLHDSDQLGREPADRQPQLHRAGVARARRQTATAANGDPVRIGGGGDTNIMMDGVGVMDTGSNRPLLQMNVESIAEVKVLTSGYQAEYGRSSGLQITAVTKSGTNRFRGSVYDVERNSDWYSNSKAEQAERRPQGDPRRSGTGAISIGGPIGKPGGNNKLFFFYSQEFAPRTGGNERRRGTASRPRSSAPATSRRRTDQNGALYNLHQGPVARRAPAPRPTRAAASRTAACSARFRRRRSTRPGSTS